MNTWKTCLNWKGIAGVALFAAGLFVFTPGLAAAALPLLILAICPLSMVVMMVVMNGNRNGSGAACSTGDEDAAPEGDNATGELASLRAQQRDLSRRIATVEGEARRPVDSPVDTARTDASAASH